MAVQTTYATSHNAAYAGMLADEQLFNTVSKLNKFNVCRRLANKPRPMGSFTTVSFI